jgi:parallel beta-helix repeat protein
VFLNSDNDGWYNNAGIKMYYADSAVIENNTFYDNTVGMFDKKLGSNNIIRYNLFTDSMRMNTALSGLTAI